MSYIHDIITDPAQATPEWLTRVLRESGCLSSGEVVQVQTSAQPTYTSTVAQLVVSYSAQATPRAPARLFLKLARPESQQSVVGNAQRRREVEFHSHAGPAARMPNPPLVRCHRAEFCAETGASLLLFDDLSDTHFGGVSAAPPGRPWCEQAVDAFAEFHAFWWDNPALSTFAQLPVAESVASEIAGIHKSYPGFVDAAGDRLTASQRQQYERVLAALPRLLQRATRGKHLTLIHGDANLSNVLLPRDAECGLASRALIIDWQLWGVSYATEDLSNLMALFWDRDPRHAMELDLLRRYHAGLMQHAVKNYTWDDCWYDYRLAVIARVLFMPMWFYVTGAPRDSVWASLIKAWQAFEDLGCQELLDG